MAQTTYGWGPFKEQRRDVFLEVRGGSDPAKFVSDALPGDIRIYQEQAAFGAEVIVPNTQGEDVVITKRLYRAGVDPVNQPPTG